MEMWDAYYEDGSLAGRDLVRDLPIPEGLYHLVSEVLVRHRDGDYLLMKRSPHKKAYPGYYEATAGGSALKGEDALACAIRELREETGITDGALKPMGKAIHDQTIFRTFLCVTEWDKNAVTLQEGETTEFLWVSERDFISFLASDKAIAFHREHFSEYYREMGYME